jgi:hypothetical protein
MYVSLLASTILICIFNNISNNFIHYCSISVQDIVAILISFEKGKKLVDMLKSHNVNITITHMPKKDDPPDSPGQLNNTSVLFVSISFIVLIIISLAWLVFYYIQRCRYTNAKERLSVSSCLINRDRDTFPELCKCVFSPLYPGFMQTVTDTLYNLVNILIRAMHCLIWVRYCTVKLYL